MTYFEGTSSARALLEEARKQNLRPARVLREAGVDAAAIDVPALRLPWRDLESLIRAAVHLTQDAAFGLHAGAAMDFRYIGMAGPYALNHPCVRDGIRITWGEVQPLVTNVIRSELLEAGSTATLRLHCPLADSEELAQLIEFYLMSHVACSRLVTRPEWKPLAVRFRHPRVSGLTEYRRLFGCTPEFGQPVSELVFDRAFLDIRFPLADARLLDVIRPQYEAYLEALRRDSTVTLWLREVLLTVLDGHHDVDLAEIAKRMQLRPRTLQHKLAAERTTFNKIRDAVRREVAVLELGSSKTTPDVLAVRLGYSDARAFLRAFRRWTGHTPGQWRDIRGLSSAT